MRTRANKSVETNRRPASPPSGRQQLDSASCAPASVSAAVAHLFRSATALTNSTIRTGATAGTDPFYRIKANR
ncbi:MAG: hypothetical protein WCQ21_26595 [Verrucomicrobiota bacterium]